MHGGSKQANKTLVINQQQKAKFLKKDTIFLTFLLRISSSTSFGVDQKWGNFRVMNTFKITYGEICKKQGKGEKRELETEVQLNQRLFISLIHIFRREAVIV
jgi:hypothetical protein